MTVDNRLLSPFGTLIDRNQTVEFSFEEKTFSGYAGDTVASALAANNQWLLSRSFKYHRPRGVLTMAGQDANSMVQLPSDPNALADRIDISPGLKVMGQNYSGSLTRDRNAVLGLVSRFLPVAFYYKAFFKPRGMWQKWAPFFRQRAGLGRIDQSYQAEYHDKQYQFYDVAIVGGGPAGLSAALAAADSGASVLLVDENVRLGGSLNYARSDAEGTQSGRIRDALLARVEANPKIVAMSEATCNGWFSDNWLPIICRKRLYKVRARKTILCVGAIEQPAIFHNNDLPGVMLGSAAQRLIKLYAVRPGQSAVVLTGNNDGYAVALDLIDAGVDVKAIVDLRDAPVYDAIAEHVSSLDIAVKIGHAVYAAKRNASGLHLGAVDVRKIVGRGRCTTESQTINCDTLCMSVGYTPTYQLICQAGGRLSYDDDSAMFTLSDCPENCYTAGSVNGYWDLKDVISDAERAAFIATQPVDVDRRKVPSAVVHQQTQSPNHPWPIFAHPKGCEFVDFDEDLQIADIVNATRDGYQHIQLVKRYSTCGMGPSQGRHSALATARLVADATQRTVAQTGVTTARPPFSAEHLALSAGRSFYPARRSNMHYRHLESGAQMLQAGAWYRPAYYGDVTAREDCIQREVNNVRNNVGIIDVSTLGGIEVRGIDAGEFLNRFYTFGFLKQPVGRARYALLTNEAGVVIDDGVACRFGEQHFYLTATTGGADRVYQSMLKWNAQWRLDVDIANVTSAYAGVNIAGPNARKVLAKLCTDIDLSAAAFPYMGVREGTVAGIPARVIRVGFVGELGYEVHVPQHAGEALWDALISAGKDCAMAPFGVEAQRMLRLEKGHIIIGQDTDAMSNPAEVQMGWAVSKMKPFFVGGRTLQELGKLPLKRCLVGFVIDDPLAPIPLESHLVLEGDKMTGRVTSVNYSPTLGKPVGLAYVPPNRAEAGDNFTIKASGGVLVVATVVDLPFYDADNRRQEL